MSIRFKAKPYTIGTWTILRLPEEASAKLPSRGQTMVEGTINGFQFRTPLEPDGKGSHWLKIDKAMQQSAGVRANIEATLVIEPTKSWPEPEVPADIQAGVDADPQSRTLWTKITPMARHEWLRWIGSTKQPETRQRRIEVARSKLKTGMRRPCCFNRNMCCVPDVSKNGVLLDPGEQN